MRSRGFSLLEALVTLVIIALVVTLLMQGLLQVLSMRTRLLEHDARVTSALLHERWFRESVEAAVADVRGGLAPFTGDAATARWLGAAPLDGVGLEPVEWRIERVDRGVQLQYLQGGRRIAILSGGLASARFEYLDAAGRWHATWPASEVDGASGSVAPYPEALPRMVRLDALGHDGRRWQWWAAIAAGPRMPLLLEQGDAGGGGNGL